MCVCMCVCVCVCVCVSIYLSYVSHLNCPFLFYRLRKCARFTVGKFVISRP